jgi:hypothetical protein
MKRIIKGTFAEMRKPKHRSLILFCRDIWSLTILGIIIFNLI